MPGRIAWIMASIGQKDEGGRVYGMAEILERLEEYFDNDSEETEENKKIIHDTINDLKDKYRIVRDF